MIVVIDRSSRDGRMHLAVLGGLAEGGVQEPPAVLRSTTRALQAREVRRSSLGRA